MRHTVRGPRSVTSRAATAAALSIACAVAFLGTTVVGTTVAGASTVTANGSIACASTVGSTTLQPGLSSDSTAVTLGATLSLGACRQSGSTNTGTGGLTGHAVLSSSVQNWSCSALLGEHAALTQLTVTWAGSPTALRSTTLTSTGLDVTTDAAGRLALDFTGWAGSGSFTGATSGSASTLDLSLKALASTVSSQCGTTPTTSLLVQTGTASIGPYINAPVTLTSGATGNTSSANVDTATSLCVQPSSGASAPTGAPLTWPGSVASAGCRAGTPANPYVESSGPWSATLAGARWVGTDPTGGGADNYWTGSGNDLYDYDIEFTVPACTIDTIALTAYADNGVGGYLDGSFVAGQASDTSSSSFTTSPLLFPSGVTAGAGHHVIDLLVDDTSTSYTGVLYSVTLTPRNVCGTLTICKVAGPGVAINTPHSFHLVVGSNTYNFVLNAGPGPAGYCFPVASYLTPQSVAVSENIPAGEQVQSLTQSPPGGVINVGAGTDSFTLGGTTTVTYTDEQIPQGLTITKSVNPTAFSSVGTVLTFTFVVTNPGSSPLTSVLVTDPLPGLSAITCTPYANPIPTLAAHQSVTCTATYTVTQADLDHGLVSNTVTATTKGGDGVLTASATASVPGVQVPGIELDKTATPGVITNVGQVITYTFTVTNTGNVTLTNVLVSDPLVGLSAITCTPYSNPIPSLAPGQTVTCTATYTVTATDLQKGGVSNTATAVGTSPTDTTVSSNGTWTVPTLGQPFTCESPSPADFLSETGSFYPDTQLYGTQYPLGVYYPLGPLYAPSSHATYNALAFSPVDHFLYATRIATTSMELMKIDSSGNVVWTKTVAGFPGTGNAGPDVGAFDGKGNYWVTRSTATGGTAYEINVATQTEITQWNFVGSSTAKGWAPADWALIGTINAANTTYLFGASATRIYRVDLTTHVVTSAPAPGLMATVGSSNPTFGAAWTFSNGDLGFSNNATGNIFEVSSSNPFAANPTWNLVGHSIGPNYSTTVNDGAACIGQPADLSIVKTGPATVTGGGTITWVITVTNHGPGNSSGFVVNDTLPANVTNLATPTPGCTITGHTLQCVEGTLVVGNSFNIIVTGTAPNTNDTCVTNTASVIGNEADPNAKNNTSSVQTCTTTGINVTKSSNVSTYTVAGQLIRFSFKVGDTAKATGTAGYDGGALSDVTVTDSLAGVSAITCPGTGTDVISSLASGASATCTATYLTTLGDVTRGSITDIATASGYDAAGHAESAKSNALVVRAALHVATASVPAAVVGTKYTVTLVATGGTAPYAWSYVGTPAIATQIKLSSKGVLSGTPTKAGVYKFTVKVKDTSSKALPSTTVEASFTLTVT